MTETKRDLHADLAICEAVTEVYYDEGGGYTAVSLTETAAQFFEEAPTAWTEAIRRAITTEAEIERLRAEVKTWRDEALRQYPTPEAYYAACAAVDKHRLRADTAEEENERLRGEIMTVLQRARNDVNRREGGQFVGTVTFADYPFAKRLVRDLQPILFPEVAE